MDWKRYWRSALGIIFLIPPAWHALHSLIMWGGDIDFVISRSADPGWVGNLIDFLLNPPGVITLPFIVIGLLLIYWDNRRASHSNEPKEKAATPKTIKNAIRAMGLSPQEEAERIPVKAHPSEFPPWPFSLEGMVRSNRSDFDLIPAPFVLRGERSDDGIDIHAFIPYRNRSTKAIHVTPAFASYILDYKMPDQMSGGISALIPKESTDSIRFNSVRIYKEQQPVKGVAILALVFGASKESMRSIMAVQYEFNVIAFPESKGREGPIPFELTGQRLEYYVKESGPLSGPELRRSNSV